MATQLTSPVPSNDAVDRYRADGYTILRGVFGAEEVAALASESQTLLDRKDLIDPTNIRCRWSDHVTSGECLFDCFDPVVDVGPVCRFFAGHERILAPLRAIFGQQAFLLKDKLIFKRPGAKGYALHQDYISWKDFPKSFTTVILAIDPTDAENGATEVFPRLHDRGCLSDEDGDYHELPLSAVDPSQGIVLDLQPGDLAIFSGFTPHRSAANLSERWRRQLYLSYNAADDGGQQRDAHYRAFHVWLRQKYAQYGKTDVYFR